MKNSRFEREVQVERHPDGCEATGGPCSGPIERAWRVLWVSRWFASGSRRRSSRSRARSRRWPDCFGRCIGSLHWSSPWRSVAMGWDAAHTGIAEKLIAGIRCPTSRNDHSNRAISN